MAKPIRHYVIPDCQIRPGDCIDHLEWIGKDIVRRRPDVIVCIGDFFDLPSLSSHAAPGSLEKENARLNADIDAGMQALERLMAPIIAERMRRVEQKKKQWNPRLVVTTGNHEFRATRVAQADPRLLGVIGTHLCDFARFGFEVYDFLEPVEIDGVWYAHYWQSKHSHRPIGGTIDNRLNKLGFSFIAGHEQGKLYGSRSLPNGRTIHGIVAGSCYLGVEGYRGPQAANEWRGTVVLHDVRNGGDFEPMFLTLRYLCQEYTGQELNQYMNQKYPGKDWSHLA